MPKSKPKLYEKLAFVDVETTGASAQHDRVIEIGILRVENGKLVQKYTSLIDPECPINPYITAITGITQEDVKSAPTFHQILPEIQAMLEGCVFVAHNVRFDYGFIKAEFDRHGQPFNYPHFCTVKLSRTLYPNLRHHNLDSVMQMHNIKCKHRHRAFDDARVLWEFYKKVQKKFPIETLQEALGLVSKKTSWPSQIPREEVERLPESPGVYIFYGQNNTPLYVGKSVNIRSRVMSHFNSDIRSGKEMKIAQQVQAIETIPTAGEFGALYLESRLVKKLMPLLNRQLRSLRQPVLLRARVNKDGYMTAEIEHSSGQAIDPDKIDEVLGVFRTKSQAVRELNRILDEHRLCKKLLGMEKTSRSCFGYQLKKCDGACIGEVPAQLYNVQFDVAFSKLRLKKWPYERPIVISEQAKGRHDQFLIDKWCCISKLDPEESQSQEVRSTDDALEFDLDIYNILRTFLSKPQNQLKVKLASRPAT